MGSVELVPAASVTAYAIAAALLGRADPPQPGLLRYRRPSEADRPPPSSTWWVPPVSALVAALVSWCAMPNQRRSLLVATPLLAAGPWLAAVDIDVRRLPDRVLLPVAGVTLVAIVALVATDPPVLVRALACGFAGFAIYFALHLASAGSIGFGDVKFAGVVGLVAGFHGLVTVWWSFLARPTPVPEMGGADPTRAAGQDRVRAVAGLRAGPDLTVRRQIWVQATSMSRPDTPASLTARPTSPRAKLVAPYSGHRVKRTVNRAVSPTIRTSSYSGPVSKTFLIDSATATRCSMSACPTTALPVSAAGA